MLRRVLPLAVVAAAEIAVLLATALPSPKPLTPAERRAERADVGGPFPLELRSPTIVSGTSARVLVSLNRPSLGDLMAKSHQSPTAQRAYVRSLTREERALISALEAKGVRFGDPILYQRVFAGFAATVATDQVPRVQTLGLRVEPVTRFYPAQVPGKDAPRVRPLPTRAARRARIAVLDAFPPRSRKAAVMSDEVGRAGNKRPLPAENDGLRLAAVLGSELPGAKIANIRVAGAQARETGKFEVFGATDQLLAGLERAVDPDRNGDATDAFAVVLTGLSAPYSGFEGSPAAEAVDGATELGSLVVAPAGNGGRPEGPFGSIGAPGAARTALTVGALDSSGDPAPGSSIGPTYGLTPKPDLAISGGARTRVGTAWGTAVAAARVGGVAAALRAQRPRLTARQVAAALITTAAPRGEPMQAGGGDPLLQAASTTTYFPQPAEIALRAGKTAQINLDAGGPGTVPNRAGAPKTARASGSGTVPGVRVAGSARARRLFVSAPSKAKPGSGRIQFGSLSIPYTIIAAAPPAPPIGQPRVIMRKGKPDGVRFTAGSIKRGDKGTSVIPVGNLVLTLDGRAKRELTPPGGARDLLPGEYAYTLTDEIKSELAPGRYRFVLRARGTAGGRVVAKRSRAFRVG